jgi:hypothetical protein
MIFPKDILYEILYFLDWIEFYKVIKYFKYDISKQLKQYNKSNNSLEKMTIDNMCLRPYEYLEIVKFLYSIGKKCSTNAMDYASAHGYLKIVKYLHSIGAKYTSNAMNWASRNGNLEIVKYLNSIGEKSTIYCINSASGNGHMEIVKYLHNIGKDSSTDT